MGFDILEQELDRWAAARRVATLWWRDDDAVAMSAPLATLLDAASRFEVPVAIAVVPAALEASLPTAVEASPWPAVLQHGYAHRNHAPAGERSRELGGTRPLSEIVQELATGLDVLREAFGERALPVLVPPWNRVDDAVVNRLPAIGYRGLSTFGIRESPVAVAGLVRCNTHVDPILWREDRRFVGAEAACELLVAHLSARRTGEADADEATGLLTHHLVFGPQAWRFVHDLLAVTRRHPAARWISAAEAFAGPRGRNGPA